MLSKARATQPALTSAWHIMALVENRNGFSKLKREPSNSVTKLLIADVVDHIAPYTGMAPEVMQERLIRLYQTYVCEWDSVRDHIAEGLLDSVRLQGAA
jgi:hypothetical protein